MHDNTLSEVLGLQDTKTLPSRGDKNANNIANAKLTLEDKDWKQLASAILTAQVSNKPPPTGLDIAITLSQDAIRLRRECRVWYHGGDEGHDDFIDVLKAVLEILIKTQNNSKQAKKARSRPKQSADAQHATKDYTTLTLEEPSASLQTPIPTIPTDNTPVRDKLPEGFKLGVEHSGTKDKILKAMYTFHECHKIRQFIGDTWKDFTGGDVTLSTAAQMTLVGCLLIQIKVLEFTTQYADLADMASLLDLLGVEQGPDRTLLTPGHIHESHTDTSDLLCLSTLTELYKVIRTSLPTGEEGTPEAVVAPITQVLHLYLLRNFLGDLGLRGTIEPYHGLEPSVLAFLSLSRQVDIKQVLLVQVQQDVGHILSQHRTHTRLVFESTLSDLRYTREKVTPLLEEAAIPAVERVFDGSVFGEDLGGALALMSEASARFNEQQSTESVPPLTVRSSAKHVSGVYSISELLPLYAGTLLSRAFHTRHMEGVLQASSTDFLVGMAHLYHAAVSVGHCKTRWLDMDHVIQNHGLKSLGLIELPKTGPLFAAAKAYGKVMGVETGTYNKNVSRKRRCADFRVPLPPENMSSSKTSTPKTSMTGGSRIFNVLDDGEEDGKKLGLGKDQSNHIALHRLAKGVLDNPAYPLSDGERQRLQTESELQPLQLLALLKWLSQCSELLLAFDYIRFFALCAKGLCEVSQKYHTEIKALRTSRGVPKEYKFRDMVDEILWEAAAEEYDGRLPASDRCSLLKNIGCVLEERYAGVDGSVILDAAVATSKGHLSDILDQHESVPQKITALRMASTLPRIVIHGDGKDEVIRAHMSNSDAGPLLDDFRAWFPDEGMLPSDLLDRFGYYSHHHARELAALGSACTVMDTSSGAELMKPQLDDGYPGDGTWKRHGFPERDELQEAIEFTLSTYHRLPIDHDLSQLPRIQKESLNMEMNRIVNCLIRSNGHIYRDDVRLLAISIDIAVEKEQQRQAIDIVVKLLCDWSESCRPVITEPLDTSVMNSQSTPIFRSSPPLDPSSLRSQASKPEFVRLQSTARATTLFGANNATESSAQGGSLLCQNKASEDQDQSAALDAVINQTMKMLKEGGSSDSIGKFVHRNFPHAAWSSVVQYALRLLFYRPALFKDESKTESYDLKSFASITSSTNGSGLKIEMQLMRAIHKRILKARENKEVSSTTIILLEMLQKVPVTGHTLMNEAMKAVKDTLGEFSRHGETEVALKATGMLREWVLKLQRFEARSTSLFPSPYSIGAETPVDIGNSKPKAMADKSTQTDTQSNGMEPTNGNPSSGQERTAQTGNAWVDIVHRRAELELAQAVHRHEGLAIGHELLQHIDEHGAHPIQNLNIRHESDAVLQKVEEAVHMYRRTAELQKKIGKIRSEIGADEAGDEEAQPGGHDKDEGRDEDPEDENTEDEDTATEDEDTDTEDGDTEEEDTGGSSGWFNSCAVA